MADNTSSSVGMAILTWPSSPRRHLAAGAVGRVDRTNSLSTWLTKHIQTQQIYFISIHVYESFIIHTYSTYIGMYQ